MNGGYILIDAAGLDLNVATAQTITGLFARLKEAISTGKPVYLCNVVDDDSKLSPIPAVVVDGTSIAITIVEGGIVVTSADAATFTAA